jgi:hypothetical protein
MAAKKQDLNLVELASKVMASKKIMLEINGPVSAGHVNPKQFDVLPEVIGQRQFEAIKDELQQLGIFNEAQLVLHVLSIRSPQIIYINPKTGEATGRQPGRVFNGIRAAFNG